MHARFYRALYRIRRVEEEIARIYPTDKIKSPCHLSIGQEAVSVGVCEALEPQDIVFGTYRGHALYLAKGGDLRRMIAELYGKATGCAGGKGGSMHLVDGPAGVMGASAVVGTSIPQSVGYAYALKVQGSDALVASFFGDGATEEGAFHEALNFAALKRLPILFICENNGYAIHAPQSTRQAGAGISERARSYGMSAQRIEDPSVEAVHEAVRQAVQAIREEQAGPCFIECQTYRWKEHVGPGDDWHAGYRAFEEARPWVESDSVRVLGNALQPTLRAAIEAEVEAEIAEAFEFAERSPFPDAVELYTDLYREAPYGAVVNVRRSAA